MNIISLIYNIFFIPFSRLIIKVLKPFNNKLREREDFIKFQKSYDLNINNNNHRIWVHASSMGEFEQAKPVIEMIKTEHPEVNIIVSFFSPSGYNNQKNYKYLDNVLYLPFDTRVNAINFINRIKPDVAVFVRYDIWRNYLEELKSRSIPSYLICATIPNSFALRYFPFLKSFTRTNYQLFSKIFTIGNHHTYYFDSLNLSNKLETYTDTRFDRIIDNVEKARNNPILPKELFTNDDLILVAGSIWSPDEDIIIDTIYRIYKENKFKLRCILVPHEPTRDNIDRIKNHLPNSVLLSEIIANKDDLTKIKHLVCNKNIIVDSIGNLLKLYGNADLAYIGGGFGVGVHSVTEPAGYGIPLSTGPNIGNSHDAIELNKIDALKVINNKDDFYNWVISFLQSKELLNQIGDLSKTYVYNLTGSSEIIAKDIINNLYK